MRRRPSISQPDKVGYRWQCAPRLLHGGRRRWSRVIVGSRPVSGVVSRHGGGHALCGMEGSVTSERGWELYTYRQQRLPGDVEARLRYVQLSAPLVSR